MVIAKTFKGAYFGEKICDNNGWHGKPMKDLAKTIVPMIEKMIKEPNTSGADKVTLPDKCD